MPEKRTPWVTAFEVARRAGVSRSAVSRAFTPGASIAPETRERVMKAANAMGYQVNMIAREMISQRSSLVGVVTAGFDNPFRTKLLSNLTTALVRNNLSPLVMNAEEPAQIKRSLEMLLSYRIAGVIMTSASPPLDLARQYLKLKVPVTMINRTPELDGTDVVISDNPAGATLAARLLRDAGVKRPAFVGPSLTSYNGRARLDAFIQAVGDMPGMKTPMQLNTPTDDYASGIEAALDLLARADRPDGVFCSSDLLALGLIDAARNRFNLRVPEDLTVVGYDDIPAAAYENYRLTTIQQDTSQLADVAVSLLIERMNAFRGKSRVRVVPVSSVVRHTCA
ncbi:LacI family DNA-binding transcriptional regulator [Paraburkholderia sp.]|uniref:LacI family DNA-binding transcriptional regulator n=1 Tax=Paraburkholderia sp. TaxID=1926495 RepID=UPI0023A3FD6A|nr:LacI family DNA-binding transcriptional regulator [Paraburkholderia sp.]MDE1179285.1 LacI family DNA-binding transcriptional regulator [Paraburkholderia sp.]